MVIIYLDLIPWTIWIVKAVFKAIIQMQFKVLIPNIKVMIAFMGDWFFIAITCDDGISHKWEFHLLAVG